MLCWRLLERHCTLNSSQPPLLHSLDNRWAAESYHLSGSELLKSLMVDDLRAWWSKPSVLCLGEFLSKTVQSIFYYYSICEFWFFSLSSPNKEQKEKKSKTSNRDGDQKGIYMKDAWKLEIHVNIKAQKPSHAQHVGEIWLALHSSIISPSIMSLTQKAQISSFQFSKKG